MPQYSFYKCNCSSIPCSIEKRIATSTTFKEYADFENHPEYYKLPEHYFHPIRFSIQRFKCMIRISEDRRSDYYYSDEQDPSRCSLLKLEAAELTCIAVLSGQTHGVTDATWDDGLIYTIMNSENSTSNNETSEANLSGENSTTEN